MSLSSVNLLWQIRMRGLMPVTRHGLTDTGHALLIRPDDLETRTYQVLSMDPNGASTELFAISVETVHKFEGAPGASLLIGMTDDDIYVFREGRKIRFMADRRVTFSDICLAPQNGWLACGFSDSLFSTHGVAFGDGSGRLGWTKDAHSPVNRVAMAHDGLLLAIGFQDGWLVVLDNMRNVVWQHAQPEPVTALAMPATGARPVVGTELGTVLAMDEDGGFRWRSPVGLPVLELATDGSGEWVAAALSDGVTHLLTCLGPDGSPVWEHQLEGKPNGVCFSPNGRFLMVSGGHGAASLFEVDFAAAPAHAVGTRRGRDLETARAAIEGGDLAECREMLAGLLQAAPHDLQTARELRDVEHRLVESRCAEARAHAAEGRFRAALELLDAAFRLDPWNTELFQQRLEVRRQALQAEAERAEALEAARDWEAAARSWTEALALDPHWMEARESLERLRQAQALHLMAEGDQRQQAGDVLNAVARWQQANRLVPSEALEERLGRAEVERCVSAGIAYYEAHRMAEAAFQFRKALALEPANQTAARYLGFAEGITGDTQLADRFARLE
jgi:hypothetical protein